MLRSASVVLFNILAIAVTIVAMPTMTVGAATVTVTNSISPAGEYPLVDGYYILMQGSNYTVSYGFKVETVKTPKAVKATYRFGSRSGNLTASVSSGKISITPLRFGSLSAGDYQLSYNIICTYTDDTSETLSGTAETGVRVMTQASSSVERTEYDAVLSGNTVTLGPISMAGGYSGGWQVQWSAGTPTGSGGVSCVYRSEASEYQINTVTATVTNSMAGQELYREVYTFSIPTYGKPSARITGAPQAAYAGSQMSLHVSTTGGNPDGWSYSWIGGDGSDSPDYTFAVPTPSSGSSIGTARVEVSNVSPEGASWFSDNIGVNYTVYDAPSVSFTQLASSIIEPGAAIPLSADAVGGQSGRWSYSWILDGQEVGTSSYYNYQAPQTDGVVVNVLRVTATNAASGVEASFEASREYRLIVMKGGGSSTGERTETATFSGSPVRLHVDSPDGQDGWSYVWWIPALVEQEGNLPSTTNELMFDREVAQTQTFEVCCRVSKVIDGQEIEINYYFDVTVYPKPSAPLTFEPDYSSYIEGEHITATLNSTGGDSNSWSYNWFLDAEMMPDHGRSYTFTATTAGRISKDADISAQAMNRPPLLADGIDDMVTNRTVRKQVFQAPTFSVDKDVYSVISGSSILLLTSADGCNEWNFVWYDDGVRVSGEDGNGLEIRPVNAGNSMITKIYRVEAKCYVPNGDANRLIRSYEHEFTVNVYPASTASWSGDYPSELIAGTDVSMGVVLADGNPDNWSISWYVNDALQSYATDYIFNRDVPGTYTVKARLTNRTEPDMSFELSHIYNVYAHPDLVNPVYQENIYVYSGGGTVNFRQDVTGGYPDGWAWRILENGNEIATGKGPLDYNYTVPHTATEVLGRDIVIILTNSHGGEDPTVFELTKILHVYPTPGVTLRYNPQVNAIGVGTSIDYTVEHTEAPGIWTFEWTLDANVVSNSESYSYTAPSTVSGMESHIVAVKATLTSDFAGMSREFENTHYFEVWPDGAISSPEVQNVGVVAGSPLTIGVNVIGTLEGWTFDWTRNGTGFANNAPTYNFNYSTEDIGRTDVFTILARYNRAGAESFNRVYTINVTVYSAPECSLASADISGYIGGSAVQTINYSGANPDGWHTEWNVFGQTGQGATFEFSIPDYVIPGERYEGLVRLYNNDPQGNIIYDENFYFSVTGYSRGEASYVSPSNTDYCGTVGEPLQVSAEGGYPDGWTFRWHGDGFDENGGNIFTPPVVNNGPDIMNIEVSVEVTNTLNGVIGYNGSHTYNITLWPTAVVPTVPALSRTSIRQGEDVTFSIETTGGNPDTWEYIWMHDGTDFNSGNTFVYAPYIAASYGEKDMQTLHYSVRVRDYGPQGQLWYDGTTEAAALNIYMAPLTPQSVVIKGNGTSRTLIAMTGQSDEVLQERGYSYVFGYTDENGDHALAPTPYRYNHFTAEQFNDGNRDFWCYCQWTYPDGSIVTSGKRYLSGMLDGEFNASVFAGGRGESAGIGAVEYGGLYSDGYIFRAEPVEAAEAAVRIYSSEGRIVRFVEYPRQSSFDERIDFGGLDAGMYIVEIQVGGLRTVKKVVVDNK